MTKQEVSDAFDVCGYHMSKAVHTIYKNMELLESETKRYIRQDNGINYDAYSLEMVIAVRRCSGKSGLRRSDGFDSR